mgnify:CR=1 FL=1
MIERVSAATINDGDVLVLDSARLAYVEQHHYDSDDDHPWLVMSTDEWVDAAPTNWVLRFVAVPVADDGLPLVLDPCDYFPLSSFTRFGLDVYCPHLGSQLGPCRSCDSADYREWCDQIDDHESTWHDTPDSDTRWRDVPDERLEALNYSDDCRWIPTAPMHVDHGQFPDRAFCSCGAPIVLDHDPNRVRCVTLVSVVAESTTSV